MMHDDNPMGMLMRKNKGSNSNINRSSSCISSNGDNNSVVDRCASGSNAKIWCQLHLRLETLAVTQLSMTS